MKSFRWTFVALVVVVGLVAFTIFDTKRAEKNEELGEKEKSTLKLKADELVRIEIANRVGSLVLERPDAAKSWRVAAATDDLADAAAVESFLSTLESEKIIKVVVAGDELKKAGLSTYGLAEPLTRLKLASGDGRTEEVRIGSVKAYDSNVYAQIETAPAATVTPEPRVLLLSSGWDVLLAKQPLDFRDKRLLRQDLTLTRFTLKRARGPELEISKNEKRWEIKSGAVAYPLDEEKVGAFFDQLKGLRATTFLDRSASANLGHPTLTVTLFKEGPAAPAFTARFDAGPAVGAGDAVSANGGGPGKSSVRPAQKAAEVLAESTDLKSPVKISHGLFDAIDKTEQDFYDDKLPFRFVGTDVDKIEINAKELTATFAKKDGVWTALGTKGEADGSKITDFLLKLGDLHANRILRADAKSALSVHPSRIELRGADGGVLFDFSWGGVVAGSKTGAKVNAKAGGKSDASAAKAVGSYVVARTRTVSAGGSAKADTTAIAGDKIGDMKSKTAPETGNPVTRGMTEQMIGLAEADVTSLPFKGLFKDKSIPPVEKKPVPTPGK